MENFAAVETGRVSEAGSLPSADGRLSPDDERMLRLLFDDYIRMYAARDDVLTSCFSENFSGFTGGGDFLVKNKDEWVAITRQDFAQVREAIRIERKDLSLQLLAPGIAVTTGFFVIHLPFKEHILSRETARLVLIFRKEGEAWKISHSSISIPYHGVGAGEVYPVKDLTARNRVLEDLVVQHTAELVRTNQQLSEANQALVKEIAERKLAEENALRSEKLYRSILLASPDDITIADEKGRIIMVSPVTWKMFRCLNVDDFIGHSLLEFIAPEDRERVMSNMSMRLKGELVGSCEYRALRLDGTTFELEANTEFIRDSDGVPTGMVVIARDISERKQVEAERARLERHNRQLQKSESLARLAGAVAHHFNNELQAVLMGLELARNELPPDSSCAESLRLALGSATKAAEVSSLMLSYLGKTHRRRVPVDLAEVCLKSQILLRSECPEGTVLNMELPSPGPFVLADVGQLQVALGKLVSNAAEASPDKQACIGISVRTTHSGGIPRQHLFPLDARLGEHDYACLEVRDSGCGIPAEVMDKIFDPFFSSKFTGRGMGLAVVLGIVRSFEGVVTVESEEGKGSCFSLFFPVHSPAADQRSG